MKNLFAVHNGKGLVVAGSLLFDPGSTKIFHFWAATQWSGAAPVSFPLPLGGACPSILWPGVSGYLSTTAVLLDWAGDVIIINHGRRDDPIRSEDRGDGTGEFVLGSDNERKPASRLRPEPYYHIIMP